MITKDINLSVIEYLQSNSLFPKSISEFLASNPIEVKALPR
jgi:hypothetical protein